MPIIKSNQHLIGYLQDMGYYLSTGMGMSPLPFTEIKAYIDLMKLDLSIWEVSTLREMSVAYVSQHNNNYDDTESPYKDKDYKIPTMSDNSVLRAFGIIKQK